MFKSIPIQIKQCSPDIDPRTDRRTCFKDRYSLCLFIIVNPIENDICSKYWDENNGLRRKVGNFNGEIGLKHSHYEYPSCNISEWYLLVGGYKSGGEIFKWRWYMDKLDQINRYLIWPMRWWTKTPTWLIQRDAMSCPLTFLDIFFTVFHFTVINNHLPNKS